MFQSVSAHMHYVYNRAIIHRCSMQLIYRDFNIKLMFIHRHVISSRISFNNGHVMNTNAVLKHV